MISPEALRGYVLEESLAAELQHSGFSLLVDSSQDPLALVDRSNGLCVRGRGADHQVDALRELQYLIPFSLPVRLFVEAKYRSSKVGLSDIRNAVGVVNDVNEHYSTAVVKDAELNYFRRYSYRYTMFSASGFTADAELFAFAQQVSLINLNSSKYRGLLRAADAAAHELLNLAQESALESFPVDQMRESFRRALKTWPVYETPDTKVADEEGFEAARSRASSLRTDRVVGLLPTFELAVIASGLIEQRNGSLFFGVAEPPFLVLLNRRRSRVSAVGPTASGEALTGASNGDRVVKSARLVSSGVADDEEEWALLATDGEVYQLYTPGPVEQELLVSREKRLRRSARQTFTALENAGDTVLRFDPVEDVSTRTRREKYVDPRAALR